MTAQLNHTIVWCRDKQKSSQFLIDMLGLGPATPFGAMLVVPLGNGVSLDYYNHEEPIARQHYAFLVSDDEFDAAFARIKRRKIRYWADPGKQRESELYAHNGGRGFYFDDPDGHLLEIMTRAYSLGADFA